jgi:hypothetical protein
MAAKQGNAPTINRAECTERRTAPTTCFSEQQLHGPCNLLRQPTPKLCDTFSTATGSAQIAIHITTIGRGQRTIARGGEDARSIIGSQEQAVINTFSIVS